MKFTGRSSNKTSIDTCLWSSDSESDIDVQLQSSVRKLDEIDFFDTYHDTMIAEISVDKFDCDLDKLLTDADQFLNTVSPRNDSLTSPHERGQVSSSPKFLHDKLKDNFRFSPKILPPDLDMLDKTVIQSAYFAKLQLPRSNSVPLLNAVKVETIAKSYSVPDLFNAITLTICQHGGFKFTKLSDIPGGPLKLSAEGYSLRGDCLPTVYIDLRTESIEVDTKLDVTPSKIAKKKKQSKKRSKRRKSAAHVPLVDIDCVAASVESENPKISDYVELPLVVNQVEAPLVCQNIVLANVKHLSKHMTYSVSIDTSVTSAQLISALRILAENGSVAHIYSAKSTRVRNSFLTVILTTNSAGCLKDVQAILPTKFWFDEASTVDDTSVVNNLAINNDPRDVCELPGLPQDCVFGVTCESIGSVLQILSHAFFAIEIIGLKTYTIGDEVVVVFAIRAQQCLQLAKQCINDLAIFMSSNAFQSHQWITNTFAPSELFFAGDSWQTHEYCPDEWMHGFCASLSCGLLEGIVLVDSNDIQMFLMALPSEDLVVTAVETFDIDDQLSNFLQLWFPSLLLNNWVAATAFLLVGVNTVARLASLNSSASIKMISPRSYEANIHITSRFFPRGAAINVTAHSLAQSQVYLELSTSCNSSSDPRRVPAATLFKQVNSYIRRRGCNSIRNCMVLVAQPNYFLARGHDMITVFLQESMEAFSSLGLAIVDISFRTYPESAIDDFLTTRDVKPGSVLYADFKHNLLAGPVTTFVLSHSNIQQAAENLFAQRSKHIWLRKFYLRASVSEHDILGDFATLFAQDLGSSHSKPGRNPILIADLITRPAHSIINQSFDSRLRVDLQRPQVNGDGFGVGWYDSAAEVAASNADVSRGAQIAISADDLSEPKRDKSLEKLVDGAGKLRITVIGGEPKPGKSSEEAQKSSDEEFDLMKVYTSPDGPCVFTSILPAWNNLNLIRLTEKIRSELVFAHVRAASPGFPISETNCHPWSFGKFLWMHNGYIAQFQKIKRKVQASLRDSLYQYVQGNTDSEWAFAMFLNQLPDPLHGKYSTDEVKAAVLKTVALLDEWSKEAGITEISLMNFAVSDGQSIICTRYVNSATVEPASLFYSTGSEFVESKPGTYKMCKRDRREDIIVIASEPLTYERTDWISVPPNTCLVVTTKLNLLVYPIEDKYYTERRARLQLDTSEEPNLAAHAQMYSPRVCRTLVEPMTPIAFPTLS